MKSIRQSTRSLRFEVVLVIAVLLATALLGPARAEQRGKTMQGRAYVTGGVAEQEQLKLQAERPAYSLWVITAAVRSGAYLADARLRIHDAKRQLVFDGKLDGPWLFIDLALGQYEVEASWQDQTVRSKTTIHAGDRHQMVAYFKLADDSK